MQHSAKLLRDGKTVLDSVNLRLENCDVPNGFQGFGGSILDLPTFSPFPGNYQLEFDDGRMCDIVFFDKTDFRVNGRIE